MGRRIDKVTVIIEGDVEFGFPFAITYAFVPKTQDDPLVLEVLKRHQEQNRELALAAGTADISGVL